MAGGRRYCHVNANGDVEPCVFCHYSNANIKDVSLINVLLNKIYKYWNNLM
ncbi:SPASM domain-containing protein [Clostridium sp.]|uniref:SPASM domain-containing protein n=1 Tax=Clostridium sp. TaxID=1506 RepID=UPI003433065B